MEMDNLSLEIRFSDLEGLFCDFICYGTEKEAKQWFSSEIEYQAFRFAFGQYIKKGACRENIRFFEYCQALSPNIAGGILKEARSLGVFPKYKKSKAKKYKIGKGCGGTHTDSIYGYEEEEK